MDDAYEAISDSPDDLKSRLSNIRPIDSHTSEEEEAEPLTNEQSFSTKTGNNENESLEAIKGRLTALLLLSVFSAALSSFQYGYHLGVVNSPGAIIKDWYLQSFFYMHGSEISNKTNNIIWSVSVSIYAFGGIFGGLATGWLADNLGRKRTLLYNNALVFVSTLLTGSAKYLGVFYLIIVGRFIIGVNCGINSNLVPLYLTEIAPARYRGALGSVHQLTIAVSILVSLVLGLPSVLGNETLWPMLFVFSIVPCVLQIATFIFCPESPKFTLVIKGDGVQAKKALQKLRGENDVTTELEIVENEAAAAANLPKVTICKMFGSKSRWPLCIALVLVIVRQLSGVNVINFYSTMLFRDAGLSSENAAWASVAFGLVKVFTTLASLFVFFGLLSGFAGCALSFAILTAALTFKTIWIGQAMIWTYVSISSVLLFILCWAWGPGTIPWFYITEVFSSSARGKATSLASTCNWTSSFIVGLAYLPLHDLVGQYTFLICACIVAAGFMFTLLYVPETKGKSPQEIQDTMLNDKRK